MKSVGIELARAKGKVRTYQLIYFMNDGKIYTNTFGSFASDSE